MILLVIIYLLPIRIPQISKQIIINILNNIK